MSLNDRCDEGLEILRHGGTVPDVQAVRYLLREVLDDGARGIRFQDGIRYLVYALKDANPDMAEHVWDGEWHD